MSDFDADFGSFGNDMPEGATGSSSKVITQSVNGKTVKKTTVTYSFPDGHTETNETVEHLN